MTQDNPASVTELGLGFHWNDLHVGQKFRTMGRTIFEADVVTFVAVTGMQELPELLPDMQIVPVEA